MNKRPGLEETDLRIKILSDECRELRAYLFTDKPVLEVEEAKDAGGDESAAENPAAGSLCIGSLREEAKP